MLLRVLLISDDVLIYGFLQFLIILMLLRLIEICYVDVTA